MTRFWWVRHGPTHIKAMLGWTDRPADLTDTDRIARLAGFLPAGAVVVSSDLIRASATADAITGQRPRLPHDPDLREMHFGDWEMRGFEDIEAEDPERIRAFYETPGLVRPPGGESWHEICARVDAATDRLAAAHAGRDIVVVAHFGAILSQIQRATGQSGDAAFDHRIDNLSVTEISLLDRWRVARINHKP